MSRLSRRDVIQATMVAGSLGLTGTVLQGQELPVTPHCGAEGTKTPAQTQGPFFRAGSSERNDMVEPGSNARVVELSGFVLTRGCNPVARAVVDIWHADERGAYDNKGFRYRGRVYTDEKGRYHVRTIQPAVYTGRTRHYHVNVAAGGKLLLTTQLYFPNEPGNRRDGLFRKELLMEIADHGGTMVARFDFVVDLKV
jgi:protocatechuate 3,4-dioxygenase beta subunit